MNKQEKTKYSRSLQNNFWLIKRIWQYTPGYVIWMIIQGILWGIHHSIGVIYMKFLFEELGGTANFVEILQIILCYGIYMLVFYYVHYWYWYVYKPASKQKLHIKMHEILFRQAVDIDLCKYDEPEFYNDFIWAMDKAFEHTAGMMDDTERLINRCVAAATLTGVLFSVDKIVAVIIFAVAVFRLCMTFIVNRLQLERVKELNPLERKEEYIKRVFRLPDYAKELRKVGFTGVYHVCRLREGIDNDLPLEKRIATIEAACEAGLERYYCVEPIGPEHTYEEMVEEMLRARKYSADVAAVMKRTCVPGTVLAAKGEVSSAELAKICAVGELVMKPKRAMGVHEPDVLSLMAGANQIYAEVSVNPRDLSLSTETSRGASMEKARGFMRAANWIV